MSAISSLASNPAPAGPRNAFAEVTSEQWLGIILEELTNQDPLAPNDTAATLEQLNSLRSIESDLSLQSQLESLVLQNSIGQAGALIGRQVEGLSTTGQAVAGVVESVRVVEGESRLQLQSGSTIEFSNVTNVANVVTASAENASLANPVAGLARNTTTTATPTPATTRTTAPQS